MWEQVTLSDRTLAGASCLFVFPELGESKVA